MIFLNVNERVLSNFTNTVDISKFCICSNIDEVSSKMLQSKKCCDVEAPANVPLLTNDEKVVEQGKDRS